MITKFLASILLISSLVYSSTLDWLYVQPQGALASNCGACSTVLCATVKTYNKYGIVKYYSSSFNHVQGQIATGTYPNRSSGVGIYTCFVMANNPGLCEYQYMPTTTRYNPNIPQVAYDHQDDCKIVYAISRSYDEVRDHLLMGNPSAFALKFNFTSDLDLVENYSPRFGGVHALAALELSDRLDSNGDQYIYCYNPWGHGIIHEVSPTSFELMIDSIDGYAMTATDVFLK